MSKVLVKITAEIVDVESLKTLGTFRVVDTSDLQTDDQIARAIDFVLEIADNATNWERLS